MDKQKNEVQVNKNLPKRFTSISETDNRLSLYPIGTISTETIIECTSIIGLSFPSLEKGFYEILFQRIKERGFTDKRLIDAVNHVIDTCVYPQPTIAQFISYDRSVEVFNYNQMIEKVNMNINAMSEHQKIKVHGISKPMWASKEDAERFNLEKYVKEA